MFINLHAVGTLDARVAVGPHMKASLFALQNFFNLIFVLLQLYLAKICWILAVNNKYMRRNFVFDLIANNLMYWNCNCIFSRYYKILVNGFIFS